jgi:hypothetical protein
MGEELAVKPGGTKVRSETAAQRLWEVFARGGCIRIPNPRRRAQDKQAYRKGFEVRLSVRSDEELRRVREWLAAVALKAGRPYQKLRRTVLPIYVREAVATFERLIATAAPRKSPALAKLK